MSPVRGEPAALVDPVPTGKDHRVMFYSQENELYDKVTEFLLPGLALGEPVVVVGATARRSALVRRLRQATSELERGIGSLRFLEAETTLETFMVDSLPDEDRFRALVADLVGDQSKGPVRIYGEMVDVLWRQGNRKGAIALEELWSDLQRTYSFALMCSYRMGEFYKHAAETDRVCSTHTHVFPSTFRSHKESSAVPSENLLDEIEHRRRVENALRESLRDLRHAQNERDGAVERNERLTSITAAIAAAVTHEQVYQAVVEKVSDSLGASSVELWVVDDDQMRANLVKSVGYDAKSVRALSARLDSLERLPVLDAIVSGDPMWIPSQEALVARYPNLGKMITHGRSYQIAVLPVRTPGRILGAIGFTFDNAPALDDGKKGLMALVARYSGQALERLRLLDAERHNRAQTELLYRLAGAVNAAQSIEEIFSAALDAIEGAVAAPRSAILSYDDDGVIRFKAWRGLSESYRHAVEGHSPWSRDTRSPEPLLVSDVDKDPTMSRYLSLFQAEGIGALSFIPLVANDVIIGKFMVYFDTPRNLSLQEIDMVKAIASHVATALARFAAAAELQRSIRFNEMFTGILGHDLRNPLSAILMAAQLLDKRSDDENLKKPLARLISSGHRMARMIDQLLDFTRVRLGGGIPLLRAPTDLASLMRQTLDELHDAHPDSILKLERHGDTSGTWDADRLLQVFSNLVGNAVQHGGGHEVLARIDGTNPDHVFIEIRNHGTIPSQHLSTLFDPLTQVSRQKEAAQGLGLGLHITREIVCAHQGRVRVESTDSEGTAFIIDLPRTMVRPDGAAA